MILIGGTRYAGELKKSMFTVMNYLLPSRACCPCTYATSALWEIRQCSLACQAPARRRSPPPGSAGLIGRRRARLGARAACSNFEGGCYAKGDQLSPRSGSPTSSPQTQMFGTGGSRMSELDPATIESEVSRVRRFTENTRACYPLPYIRNTCRAGRPDIRERVFLTADAFACLAANRAALRASRRCYYFLSGYTAKGGRHRARSGRNRRRHQRLLRRGVPRVASHQVRRQLLGGWACAAQGRARVAGQHGMERRSNGVGAAVKLRTRGGPWCARRSPANSTACP